MRGRLRIGVDNLMAAKLCVLSAFIGAQFLGAQASSPAASDRIVITRMGQFDKLPHSAEANCVKCHAQSTGRAEEVVRLHSSSAHGRSGLSCDNCHGGDPTQIDKAKAHSLNFTGKPDRSATLTMCGACHAPQLAQFKTGRHFPEKQGIPSLDCAECHGAHSVGDQPETFSLGQFCVSCHGLEYLPPLPQQFQDLLNLSDDLREAFARLATKGRKPSDEAIKQRKDIRRLTAEIVHPTDSKGGLARIPQILSQGAKLKELIR